MKFLTVIIAFGFFAASQAGVVLLNPHEEQEVLRAFEKYCSHGSEGGEFHGAKIWCKFAKEEHEEVVNHEVIVPAPVLQDTTIFLQPPSTKYNHHIEVSGTKGIGQHTKIFVLPQKSAHSIKSKYNPGEVIATKPTVYFLKNSGDEGLGYRYGTPAPPGVAGYA